MQVILCHEHGFWRHLQEGGEDGYREDFARAVAQLGDHPAVFGFNVGDEPTKEDFPHLCRAMRIQKEIAPHLTPFANLMNCHPGCEKLTGYLDWAGYLDAYVAESGAELLCYDCYSHMNPGTEGWDHYFLNLRLFHEAAQRHDLPYWTTLLSASHWRFRPPSEDDFRWQLSTALAHGAQGILWFFFYMRDPHSNYRTPPIDEHYERTETYDRLSRVCRTFLKSEAEAMRGLRLVGSWHVGQSWGGWPRFDGTGRIAGVESEHGTALIVSEFADARGRPHVMLVNNSPWEATRATMHVRGRRPRLHQVRWLAQESPRQAADAAGRRSLVQSLLRIRSVEQIDSTLGILRVERIGVVRRADDDVVVPVVIDITRSGYHVAKVAILHSAGIAPGVINGQSRGRWFALVEIGTPNFELGLESRRADDDVVVVIAVHIPGARNRLAIIGPLRAAALLPGRGRVQGGASVVEIEIGCTLALRGSLDRSADDDVVATIPIHVAGKSDRLPELGAIRGPQHLPISAPGRDKLDLDGRRRPDNGSAGIIRRQIRENATWSQRENQAGE